MKKIVFILGLFVSLLLSTIANAEETPESSPVSAVDYAMVVTYALLERGDSSLSSECSSIPEVKSLLVTLIEDDLSIHSTGGDSLISEEILNVSNADRAAASKLYGFVVRGGQEIFDRIWGDLSKEMNKEIKNITDTNKKIIYPDRYIKLYEDIKSKNKSPSETIKFKGCFLSAFETMSSPLGLMQSNYHAYLPIKLAEYRNYRSTEGYQSARWGMTPIEVRKAEALTNNNTKTVSIDGYPSRVSYLYTDDRLSSVRIRLLTPCLPAVCYERFLKISEIIQSKYGDYDDNSETDSDTLERTSSSLYQDISRESGLVSDGYRREMHSWKLADSKIDHILFSTLKPLAKMRGTVIEEIVYTSTRFKPRALYLEKTKSAEAAKTKQKNI